MNLMFIVIWKQDIMAIQVNLLKIHLIFKCTKGIL